MAIFDYSHYKKFIGSYIKEKNRRGLLGELAKAIGCTHSYLSQVLRGKPDLTLDQGFALARYLHLSAVETEYLLLLIQTARAATPELRRHLVLQTQAMKDKERNVTSAVAVNAGNKISLEQREYYYDDWRMSALHILTACVDFQTAASLAQRLNLRLQEVEALLEKLTKTGLVVKRGSRFIHSGTNIHLPTEALYNRINNLNWRLRAAEKRFSENGVHYTSVFAVDREAWEALKSQLLTFISQQRKEIGDAGTDDAFVFCCDLFRV